MIAGRFVVMRIAAAASTASLLLSGCIQRGSDGLPVVTEMATPAEVSQHLSPVDRRWAGEARDLDLNLLRATQREAGRLPKDSRARAAAVVWSEAAMTGYLADPATPWLEQALLNAQQLVAQPEAGRADPVAALLQWGAWVEAESGFLVAMPIYARAESSVEPGSPRSSPPPVTTDAHRAVRAELAEAEARWARLYRDRVDLWINSFAFARATAWLRFAIDEAARRDRSGVVDDALAEFELNFTTLKDSRSGRGLRDAMLGWARRSDRFAQADGALREDLWQVSGRRTAQLRGDYLRYDPAAATLARLDVVLLQATHEYNQRGLPAARPYLLEAEAIVAQADAAPAVQP